MSKQLLKSNAWTCTLPTMMLRQETQVIYTLNYPKSMECMYVTRNMRLSFVLAIDHFLDLLQFVTQTHELNT